MVTQYEYTEAKKNLDELLDSADSNHVPIKIIRKKASSGYIISEDDYDSLQETLYLLSNPANAEHLRRSITGKNRVVFDSIEDLKHETGL